MNRFRMLTALAVLTAAALVGVATPADRVAPGACCDNVCVRVPETKKVVTRVYSEVCEPLCLPKCSILGHLFGRKDCCADGACGECSQRTKKTLVVKLRTCDVPSSKCIAQPACAPGTPVK